MRVWGVARSRAEGRPRSGLLAGRGAPYRAAPIGNKLRKNSRLFGTDGLRGVANEDLSPEIVTRLGRASATVLGRMSARPLFLVGTDTRASGDLLTAALSAGLHAAGADVAPLGVIPTPGVAWCTVAKGATAGVVISASHNPAEDNGVKFFGPDGLKLRDEVEDEIQACFEDESWSRPLTMGRSVSAGGLKERYLEHLVASCPLPLEGMRVVLDCANGAAHEIAPQVLLDAGASVEPIFTDPDGLNINDGCGSTHWDALAGEVVARGADLGLALDGDADRLLGVDSTGTLVDGDQVLAITAIDRHGRGVLRGSAVVATVMSNLGMRRALERAGIGLHTVQVGDRYVLEALRERGLEVGGEQSGHTLYLDLATTGDGTLTALQLCSVVVRKGCSLGELASVVERFPQVLESVRVIDKNAVMTAPTLLAVIGAAERRLGRDGRVLVRPSGTESVVRVMVEASELETAHAVSVQLCEAVVAASLSATRRGKDKAT